MSSYYSKYDAYGEGNEALYADQYVTEEDCNFYYTNPIKVPTPNQEFGQELSWTSSKWHRAWLKFLSTNQNVQQYDSNYFQIGVWTFVNWMQARLHDSVTEAAKTIVLELKTDNERKKIKSVNVGGIAGGTKYIHDGLMFKLSTDVNKLYAGDLNASKAARHELKSLNELGKLIIGERIVKHATVRKTDSEVTGIYIPLVCLIDYLGFTLMVSSMLPINADTLQYGSSDGGKHVKNSSSELNSKMEAIASKLNLKQHYIGRTNIQLHFPGDIEGHIGEDKQMYIIDTARMYCPEPPDSGKPGAWLYNLMRPELVKRAATPLSSDCFSMWGERDNAVHNGEARKLWNSLLNEIIPATAKKLLSQSCMSTTYERHKGEASLMHSLKLLRDPNHVSSSGKTVILNFDLLIQQIHQEGINIRHLEKVRQALHEVEAEDSNPKGEESLPQQEQADVDQNSSNSQDKEPEEEQEQEQESEKGPQEQEEQAKPQPQKTLPPALQRYQAKREQRKEEKANSTQPKKERNPQKISMEAWKQKREDRKVATRGTPLTFLNRMFLTEMVARCIKDKLRVAWRDTMNTTKSSDINNYTKVTASLLDVIFGATVSTFPSSNVSASEQFWTVELKEMMFQKFGHGKSEVDLRTLLNEEELFSRVKALTGIDFKLKGHQTRTSFGDDDIECTISPKFRMLKFFTLPEGVITKKHQRKGEGAEEVVRGFKEMSEAWNTPEDEKELKQVLNQAFQSSKTVF